MEGNNNYTILKVNHIFKTFKNNHVLRNISLEINKGDIYGILGLSGAGKSTLVRCLNGLEKINFGEILYYPNENDERVLASGEFSLKELEKNKRKLEKKIAKLNITISKGRKRFDSRYKRKLDLASETLQSVIHDIKVQEKYGKNRKNIEVAREYKKDISMIFQHFNLLDQRTVLKNVELVGELYHDPNRLVKARKCLKLVGLEGKENQYPSTLSGGEKQRVAIARALMTDPKILLCDEATSALDPETTSSILELLKELNKELNLTIIIIAHQMSVIEAICNKVAIINESRIVENGSLSDVFLNPQCDIAKRLVYANHINTTFSEKGLIRLKFNGDTDNPLIASIIQDCNILVSIVHADTKVVEGKVYGQMIIKVPADKDEAKKLIKYLKLKKVNFEEVE